MIGLTILGSTGSIGFNTLKVLDQHRDRYFVAALTANRDWETLFKQCLSFQPRYAVMVDASAAHQLSRRLTESGLDTQVLAGSRALEEVAAMAEVQYVMAAIVGAAGLRPALAAVRAGKRILLANKEALVMSGPLFIEEAERHEAQILPIDSEHNAIFQCLPPGFGRGLRTVGVRRILLTASGGPFRVTPLEAFHEVTPEQACAHPKWDMGRKISVDSATLMNKGLEVIEACWLFHAEPDLIKVLIHPQSIVHSLVEFIDGSVLAQLGNPDMRTPIAHALAWPERLESGARSLDLLEIGKLEFEAPDLERFPCLGLAYQALKAGGTAPAVLNAANEVAVEAFLHRRIRFSHIPGIVEQTLEKLEYGTLQDLDDVFESDREARRLARHMIG